MKVTNTLKIWLNYKMKKVFAFIVLGLCVFSACRKNNESIQTIPSQSYAKIHGHILNPQNQKITVIQNYRPKGITLFEDIELDSIGKFTYEIDDITTPINVRIKLDNTTIFTLYIASGYNLHFTCDGYAPKIWETLRFSGVGSQPNEFLRTISSHPSLEDHSLRNQKAYSEEEFFKKVNDHYACRDSILKSTFAYEGAQDIFQEFYHFQKINHKFKKNGSLLYHAINKGIDKKGLSQFFERFIDKDVMDFSEYDDHYFLNEVTNFYAFSYPNFLSAMNDSLAVSQKEIGNYEPFIIEMINNHYEDGNIKSAAIGTRLEMMIFRRNPYFERNYDEDSLIEAYRDVVADEKFMKEIKDAHQKEIKRLREYHFEIGDPAPEFTLMDTDNKEFDLESFKGKHLLIDVWSSTCRPCIEAMPLLREELNEFDTTKFQVLSVSLDKDKSIWQKLVQKHRPLGLQLIAEGGTKSGFAKDYLVEFLPRYILIDNQGKVVAFYAEKPQDGKLKEQIMEIFFS